MTHRLLRFLTLDSFDAMFREAKSTTCLHPTGGSPSMSSGSSTMTSCPTTATTAPPTGKLCRLAGSPGCSCPWTRERTALGPIRPRVQGTRPRDLLRLHVQPRASPWFCGWGFHVQNTCRPGFLLRAPCGARVKAVVHVGSSCWVYPTHAFRSADSGWAG